MIECDCSEEYGPCENHGTVLAQRDGAALHTADELCIVFLDDAQGIDPQCLSPYGKDVLARAEADMQAHESSWIEDPDLADELRDVVSQVESYIGPDVQTYWEDGYRIVRPAADCPLYADEGSAAVWLLVALMLIPVVVMVWFGALLAGAMAGVTS